MIQKPRKFIGAACPLTPLEPCALGARVGSRSVFILDLCLCLFVTMLIKLIVLCKFQFHFKCYIQLIIVCVYFLKFICIYFFLYYRGPCVRKLFTGLIMYLPSQNKEHCIVLYFII